ncbi:MAG: hypothetical protein LBK22_08830 [Tannerella sp.]|nr:hypothetical protein [Tannerella sp.]
MNQTATGYRIKYFGASPLRWRWHHPIPGVKTPGYQDGIPSGLRTPTPTQRGRKASWRRKASRKRRNALRLYT